MSIWKLIEKTLTATTTKVVELQKKKEELPVPTIVVTPVLEEREEYLEFGYKIEETPTIQVTEITPTTTPASSEDGNDEATQGLGISGVQYDDPLNEVDDLLAILGLDVEAEKEEVEDEIEKILEREIDGGLASKLVEKSRVLFLELGREWKEVVEREVCFPLISQGFVLMVYSTCLQNKKRNLSSGNRTPWRNSRNRILLGVRRIIGLQYKSRGRRNCLLRLCWRMWPPRRLPLRGSLLRSMSFSFLLSFLLFLMDMN